MKRSRIWSVPPHCISGGALFAAALALSATAQAATFYIRADGGDAAACTGLSDRPLADAGDKKTCAWSHPFIALPPNGKPRIAGGDLLVIRPGSYRIGVGAPGSQACDVASPWDCFPAALPSGLSREQPTRLSGAGDDGKCQLKPELWGAERAARVLNLERSSHIQVDCLEITDHASCVEQHCHGGGCATVARCERDRAPFGDWSGTGIEASDSSDVKLIDLDVHGMAMRGIHAGRLADWQLTRVRLVGNGWSGWDGDLGDDSSNHGNMGFSEVEIAWNGCVERHPDRHHFGCWGQSNGGYGDGLGLARSAGDWRFERVRVHHNASDGLDLLYLTAPATTVVRASQVYANAGNQIKATGAFELEGSQVDGSCGALVMNGLAGADGCRAGGNSIVLALGPQAHALLDNNRIRGQGDCLVVAEGGDAGAEVILRKNHLTGSPQWADADKLSCGFFAYKSAAQVRLEGNVIEGVR